MLFLFGYGRGRVAASTDLVHCAIHAFNLIHWGGSRRLLCRRRSIKLAALLLGTTLVATLAKANARTAEAKVNWVQATF